MTIAQLKEIIADLPDHMEVFIGPRMTEYDYSLVNSACVKEVEFFDSDDPNDACRATDEVFVLEED